MAKKPTPLRVARATIGKTIQEVADETGLSFAHVQKLETGNIVRDRAQADRLYVYYRARGVEISLVEIYDPEGKAKENNLMEQLSHGVDKVADAARSAGA